MTTSKHIRYNHSPKGRARNIRYNHSPKGRARNARYEGGPADLITDQRSASKQRRGILEVLRDWTLGYRTGNR